MSTPRSGRWNGLLVCADRAIKVSASILASKNGTLHGEYSFRDKKYSSQDSSGEISGTFASSLVHIELANNQEYRATLDGHVMPALPGKRQMLYGYVQSVGRKAETAVLVLFYEEEGADQLSGWDG